jgi:hypothetical protein
MKAVACGAQTVLRWIAVMGVLLGLGGSAAVVDGEGQRASKASPARELSQCKKLDVFPVTTQFSSLGWRRGGARLGGRALAFVPNRTTSRRRTAVTWPLTLAMRAGSV